MRKYKGGEPITADRLFELARKEGTVYLLTLSRTKLAKTVANMPFQSIYMLLQNKQICEAILKHNPENHGIQESIKDE